MPLNVTADMSIVLTTHSVWLVPLETVMPVLCLPTPLPVPPASLATSEAPLVTHASDAQATVVPALSQVGFHLAQAAMPGMDPRPL